MYENTPKQLKGSYFLYLLQPHSVPFCRHFHYQLLFGLLSRKIHLMGHTVPYHSAAPSLGLLC